MAYPVNLDLAGRSVLVVGGGRIAARKLAGLLDGGADRVTVVAPGISSEVRGLAAHAADSTGAVVVCIERPYADGEAARHELVLSAVDDRAVTARVSADARAAGVWVNAADDPVHCSFTLPAVVRRGRVLVTTSTGGASPALAAWLRGVAERCVGPEFAELAERLAARRAAEHAAGRSTEDLDWAPIIAAELAELTELTELAALRDADERPDAPQLADGVRASGEVAA
jgi:precorrin-2 dehydrogenase/sirohydrochlorin ferrochelatase